MTMGFSVKDTKSLAKLKVGDMVQFELKSNPKTEQYDIEHIDTQRPMSPTRKMGAHP
jgi:Cu/Ag efflux protein CusF